MLRLSCPKSSTFNCHFLGKPMTIVYLFTFILAIGFLSSPNGAYADGQLGSQKIPTNINLTYIKPNVTPLKPRTSTANSSDTNAEGVKSKNNEGIDNQNLSNNSSSINRSNGLDHQTILYTLLVAELAAQRNMPEVALNNFIQLARSTKNPAIAKEATEWAIEFQNPEMALKTSKLWADNDPNDLQAQMVATTLLIGQSVNEAIPYLKRAIELDPKEIGQQIVAIQSRLSPRSAEQLKMALARIAGENPKNPYANLAAAQSAAQQEDIQNANRLVDVALSLKPDLTSALQLKARLIRYNDTSDAKALKFLKDRVTQFANNAELRLFYANALLDANQLKDASFHLKKLTEDKEYGGQALLFLGEIYRKQGDFENTSTVWNKALLYNDTQHNAAYLLGELSEQQGQNEDAIKRYIDITTGPYHIVAQLRAADLLKGAKEFEKAITVLHDSNPSTTEEQKQLLLSEVDVYVAQNRLHDAYALADGILEKLPTDEDTLMVHSSVASKLKQWSIAEKDLKKILGQNPNHSDALNALGYILLQNNRMEEAKQYLQQALMLAPNNASYLDSMGWYHYRQGDLPEALKYLRKAYNLSNNVEIAAHLGEVLWALGKQEEAKEVWAKALSKNPEDTLLLETLAKFKVEIKPIKIVHH